MNILVNSLNTVTELTGPKYAPLKDVTTTYHITVMGKKGKLELI